MFISQKPKEATYKNLNPDHKKLLKKLIPNKTNGMQV